MADLDLERGLEVLDGRTRWARNLLIGYIALSAVVALGQVGELAGAVDLENGELGPLLLMVSAAYMGFAVVFIATIVLVGMWIYRAHSNVRAAGAGPLENTPGWAVGWFFVPIANLFKPFQAMRELWNVSHGQSDGYSQDSEPVLKLWWGFWIVSNIVTNISARSMFTGGEIGQSATTVLDVIGSLLSIPAAWFLLQIVRQVNSAQRSTLAAASTFA
jgi:hypothetical protein